jgi:hypothetical protein
VPQKAIDTYKTLNSLGIIGWWMRLTIVNLISEIFAWQMWNSLKKVSEIRFQRMKFAS